MTKTYCYVQDPNVLETWLHVLQEKPIIVYNIDELEQQGINDNSLLLLHKTSDISDDQVSSLVSKGFNTVVFSNEPSVDDSIRLFKIGIKGFLNTYAAKAVIQQAIETVNGGNVWLGQNVMQAMIQAINSKPEKNNGWKDDLTEREIQVCESVLEGQNNKQIAENIFVTERTVKAHLHNIFQKLEVKDRLSLAIKIQNWQ
ncbi:MAG: response regulator transcription factor [Pseudomonadota bacterium]|nr:response regulator transcription factor [Pseudomonadota bacterium]